MDFNDRLGTRAIQPTQGEVDEFGRVQRFRGSDGNTGSYRSSRPPRGNFNGNFRNNNDRRPYGNRGRGGYGSRGRGGYQGQGPPQKTEEEKQLDKIKASIVTLGDNVNDREKIEDLAQFLVDEYSSGEAISTHIRKIILCCNKELVYQFKSYSALIGLLNHKNSSIGNDLLIDLASELQRSINEMDWSGTRIILRAIGSLIETNMVNPYPLVNILERFLELVKGSNSLSHRSSCLVWVVGSTLVFIGEQLLSKGCRVNVLQMIDTIGRYSTQLNESPVLDLIRLPFGQSSHGRLETIRAVLEKLVDNNFANDVIVNPCSFFSFEFESATTHELVDLDLSAIVDVELVLKGSKAGKNIGYHEPSGFMEWIMWQEQNEDIFIERYMVLELISDCMAALSANRKACAKLLHSIASACRANLIVKADLENQNGSNDRNMNDSHGMDDDTGMDMESAEPANQINVSTSLTAIEIEKAIIVAFFTLMFDLPMNLQPAVYYSSLSIELRKLNPDIYAKYIQLAIKRILSMPKIESECLDRLADFHSMYLSNYSYDFNYEQIEGHSEFIRISLLKQIRLSYYDQIKAFWKGDLDALSITKPTHKFKFIIGTMDDATKEISVSVGKTIKGGGSATGVLRVLDQAYGSKRPYEKLEMLIEHMLLSGSKSFSHLLNSIEKYMPVVEACCEKITDGQAKIFIAKVIRRFWSSNVQFMAIAVDKYLNYKIIDPESIIFAVMTDDLDFAGFELWDIIVSLVNKLVLRMNQLKYRLSTTSSIDSSASSDPSSNPTPNPAEITALTSLLEGLNKDLEQAITLIFKQFASFSQLSQPEINSSDASTYDLKTAKVLQRYIEFCRRYSSQIVGYKDNLMVVLSDGASAEMSEIFDSIVRYY